MQISCRRVNLWLGQAATGKRELNPQQCIEDSAAALVGVQKGAGDGGHLPGTCRSSGREAVWSNGGLTGRQG
jgi:hypothetical protein